MHIKVPDTLTSLGGRQKFRRIKRCRSRKGSLGVTLEYVELRYFGCPPTYHRGGFFYPVTGVGVLETCRMIPRTRNFYITI